MLKIGFYYQTSILAKPDDILKIVTYHLACTLINIDDEAKNLVVYYQAFIYRSGSFLSIFYLKLRQSFTKL